MIERKRKKDGEEEHEKTKAELDEEREKREQAYKPLASEYNKKATNMLNDYENKKIKK